MRREGDLICSGIPRQILDYYWRRLPCQPAMHLVEVLVEPEIETI